MQTRARSTLHLLLLFSHPFLWEARGQSVSATKDAAFSLRGCGSSESSAGRMFAGGHETLLGGAFSHVSVSLGQSWPCVPYCFACLNLKTLVLFATAAGLFEKAAPSATPAAELPWSSEATARVSGASGFNTCSIAFPYLSCEQGVL